MAKGSKPNILVIFGDDIGITNLSCHSRGLTGYETPHIDRLAREGLRFVRYYSQQSCTAGRAAFLTGQHGIRSGRTKVGFPPIRRAFVPSILLEQTLHAIRRMRGEEAGRSGKAVA